MNNLAKIEKSKATPVPFKGAQELADFDAFDKGTAKLAALHSRIMEAARNIIGNDLIGLSNSSIVYAERLLEQCIEAETKAKCQKLAKMQEQLEPAEYMTDDGISAPYVVLMLTKFLCAFPTHNVPDPQAFLQILTEEVVSRSPNWFALHSTLLKLRRTSKFVPTLSEVLEELDQSSARWMDQLDVAESVLDAIAELPSIIQQGRDEMAKREQRRLEAQRPLQVDDRVLHFATGTPVAHRLGKGTVLAVGHSTIRVQFDKAEFGTREIIARFLLRLPAEEVSQ
jgi:hypothetical protein